MAKQTFTTGQVLTASEMTSLQQTAMGGGSATAKTASYVLVAADAGTTVAMNAAGATTITVNTALFAAGDTVFIQNLGAGACTVTAGTATVATAGSLILPQNDAGILYFTATGASIFYDYIQAGAVSPLTTKGDLYTFSTSDARLAVGANTFTLVADSAEATGLKWAAPASGGMTLLSTTTLSGASTTITLSGTFNDLELHIFGVNINTSATQLKITPNADSGKCDYIVSRSIGAASATGSDENVNIDTFSGMDSGNASNSFVVQLFNVQSSTSFKPFTLNGGFKISTGSNCAIMLSGQFKSTTAITSLVISSANTFAAGTVLTYGVK